MSDSSTPESPVRPPLRIGILLSGKGRGSNMQAIIDATRDGRIPGEVALVVSTSPGTPALDRAEAAGVPTRLVAADNHATQEALDSALADTFEAAGVELVALAGYMRLLGPAFLSRYAGRVMNVHPSLLPAFGGQGFYGKRVHQAVVASGVKFTGVTVFFVDDNYDQGPIILQRTVAVEEGDTPEDVAARVLTVEHQAYPEAIRLFAQRRLRIEGHRVHVAPSEPD